jgi:hypothetical protein
MIRPALATSNLAKSPSSFALKSEINQKLMPLCEMVEVETITRFHGGRLPSPGDDTSIMYSGGGTRSPRRAARRPYQSARRQLEPASDRSGTGGENPAARSTTA